MISFSFSVSELLIIDLKTLFSYASHVYVPLDVLPPPLGGDDVGRSIAGNVVTTDDSLRQLTWVPQGKGVQMQV